MGCMTEVPQVVGCGYQQLVVSQTICFRRNCLPVIADQVKSISSTVLVDSYQVLFDRVLIVGRLQTDVLFRELGRCSTDVAVIGDVLAEVEFSAQIEVPGSRPGDRCVVMHAFVEGIEEQPLWVTPAGGFKGLSDKAVLFLCVKVVRDSTACVDSACSPPVDTSSGESDTTGSSGQSSSSWSSASDDVTWEGDHPCSNESPSIHTSSGSSVSGSLSGSSDPSDLSSTASSRPRRSRKGRTCKSCPRRRTTGIVLGGGTTVPNAKPGRAPGTFMGPTILFPLIIRSV